MLGDPNRDLVVSVASLREVAIKAGLDREDFRLDVALASPARLVDSGGDLDVGRATRSQ